MGKSAYYNSMNSILAVQIDLGIERLAVIFALIAVIGSALGWLIFNGRKTIARLRSADRKKHNEEVKEEAELREKLLTKYREMYELEKNNSAVEVAELKNAMEELKNQFDALRLRYAEIREENERIRKDYDQVITLNVRYQEDKRRDTHEIANLRQIIAGLQVQMREIRNSYKNMRSQMRRDKQNSGETLPVDAIESQDDENHPI